MIVEFTEFMDAADQEGYVQNDFYIPNASDCMRCGLCVSTCPTFKINPIAEETPRNRIRTLDKILNQQLSVSEQELAHLNNCTQCRACEAICPSRMAYGQLFDAAQAQLNTSIKPLAKLGFNIIEHNSLLYIAATLIKLYQKTGLQTLVRKSGVLAKLKLANTEALLPAAKVSRFAHIYTATLPHRGCVALFTGCVSQYFDHATLNASITALNRIGYDVLIPHAQGCCGAIHQHQGQAETAACLAQTNITAFADLEIDAIIYSSSGCGLMLNEYAHAFKHSLVDISEFLSTHWPDNLRLTPLPKTVAVHEPCSQRNTLKNQQAVYALLAKIPELAIIPLADNAICCGAGGVHVLTHPEIAEPLRTAKLQHVTQTQADILLTSNIGCALHLQAGLKQNKFVHPVSLIAAQL